MMFIKNNFKDNVQREKIIGLINRLLLNRWDQDEGAREERMSIYYFWNLKIMEWMFIYISYFSCI